MSKNDDKIIPDRPDWWGSLTDRSHYARMMEEQRRNEQRRREADFEMRSKLEAMLAQANAKPTYQNGTNATLETDGIVIESGQTRIVVRGDLPEKLAVLVTMARMAKLIGADEGETP